MSKYDDVIEKVFFDNYSKGDVRVKFTRDELANACESLGLARIKNLGDIPYSYRFRKELPENIVKTSSSNSEWIISGTGIASYEFRLASPGKIEPRKDQLKINIPDATPEIVKHYAPGTDEQALLTKARYNRIIDIFTSLTCYSIQNHYRTTVDGVGQIEVDEIYIGINKKGVNFAIPCQSKSPGDRFGIVQVMQDIALCEAKYPQAVCKPIALQFLSDDELAILELAVVEENDLLKLNVVDEKHYKLIPNSDVDRDALTDLKNSAD